MSEMVERVEAAILSKIEEIFGVIHCNAGGAIGRAAIEALRHADGPMQHAMIKQSISPDDEDDAPTALSIYLAGLAAALAKPST